MPGTPSSSNPPKGRCKSVAPQKDPDFSDIIELAESLNRLYKQIVVENTPVVQNIIRSRCRDQQQIEHTLDRLLDCACIPEGLALFKSLCRYYYTINPSATVEYVYFYRDMWDSEEEDEI